MKSFDYKSKQNKETIYKKMFETQQDELNKLKDNQFQQYKEQLQQYKEQLDTQKQILLRMLPPRITTRADEDILTKKEVLSRNANRKEPDNTQNELAFAVVKKLEETHKKELRKILLKAAEESKREMDKMLKDSEEAYNKEMHHLISKENTKYERLRDELTSLKNQLKNYEKQQLQGFTQQLEEDVKKIYYKDINAREEMYEKRINNEINMFNRQLAANEGARRKELCKLQLKVEELKEEKAKKHKNNKEEHRKELCDLQVELEQKEAKKHKDTEEAYRKDLCDIKIQVEELRKEVAKIFEDIAETHRPQIEDQENFKQNILIEEKTTQLKNQSPLMHQKQAPEQQLTAEFEKQLHCEELHAQEKIYEKKVLEVIDEFKKQLKYIEEQYRKKLGSLQAEVDQLKEKAEVHNKAQDPALLHSTETLGNKIYYNKLTEKEKVNKKSFNAYQELVKSGKLKEYTFPLDDTQQASTVVDEFTKTFSHTYFSYDSENKEIKCQSTDIHQIEDVRKKLYSIQRNTGSPINIIDLSTTSRKITIKCDDIVNEEVDVIVNGVNNHLHPDEALAKTFHESLCSVHYQKSPEMNFVSTGDAVAAKKVETLKCKYVIFAVGPVAFKYKGLFKFLLKKACINAMNIAQKCEATSIAFAPISLGNSDVSTDDDLVANVMLSTLCSYTCSNPTLLSDVRIVINDRHIFKVFLSTLNNNQQNLQLLLKQSSNAAPNTGTIQNGDLLALRDGIIKCSICCKSLNKTIIGIDKFCKVCKEAFCKDCLENLIRNKGHCPTCAIPQKIEKGDQPSTCIMAQRILPQMHLPGFEEYNTIEITYSIPNGKQGKEHHCVSPKAYLPNSPEGNKVYQLLRRAFDAQLIFTVGTSHASEATHAVVWNDIHHKTNMTGGPTKLVINYIATVLLLLVCILFYHSNGYPDFTYLGRVMEELAAKGITE